ncbi:hypothetical protein Trydic_g7778 [Trypoxylus dichotomus]
MEKTWRSTRRRASPGKTSRTQEDTQMPARSRNEDSRRRLTKEGSSANQGSDCRIRITTSSRRHQDVSDIRNENQREGKDLEEYEDNTSSSELDEGAKGTTETAPKSIPERNNVLRSERICSKQEQVKLATRNNTKPSKRTDVPQAYTDAIDSENSTNRKKAIKEELTALDKSNT